MTSVSWTPEMEVSLFYAMIDHKPVGENKHFHMAFIYEKFNNLSDKKLSIDQIWHHLNTLYDLKGLDENEIVAFPNEEVEFSLPEIKLRKEKENEDEKSKINEKSSKTESRKSTSSSKSQSRSSTSKKK